MLIPIDDSVDVPLQNVKDVAKTLTLAIDRYQNKYHNEALLNMVKKAAYEDTNTEEEAQQYISQAMYCQSKCYTALLSNNYTYLTADVCDMVAKIQGTLKEWTIQDLPIEPNTKGVVLFEKPKFTQESVISIDIEPGVMIQHTSIVGLCWLYFTDQPLDDSRQGDVLWTGLISEVHHDHAEMDYAFGGDEFAYEVCKDGTLRPIADGDDYDKFIIDYFAATMMLTQQREIIAPPNSYRPTVKHGKRRDPVLVPTGDNTREPMKISTISLSDTVRKAYAANSAGTGQKPTKSWWVKGHWRRQAHGPNRSLRKLIYIHPHISGNVNAPLDDRKTMTKVVP